MPKAKRKIGWFGTALLGSAFLVLTGALLWFSWVAGATNRRDASLARLRDAGIATNVDDFLQQVGAVPPDLNPAIEYEKAWALIDEREEAWRAWDLYSPATAKPTRAEEVEQARLEQAVVKRHGAVLRLIAKADFKTRPAVEGVQADFGVWSQRNGAIPQDMITTAQPNLYRLADLMRLLDADANIAAAEGDADRVLRNAIRMIGMADARDSDARWLPEHSLSVSIRSWCATMLMEHGDVAAAGTPSLKDTVIQLLLDDHPSTAGYASALAGEATMQQCALRELEAGGVSLATFTFGCCPQMFPPRKALTAVIRDDAAQMGDYMLAMIANIEAPRVADAQSRLPDAWFREGRVTDYFVRVLLPDVDRSLGEEFENRTQRRLAATTLAIRSYQRDHCGNLPSTLDSLVPGYLPRVPIDPMAPDGALQYDPARGLLWSVGANGTDEGGDNTSQYDFVTRWNSADAVVRLLG